MSRTLFLVVIVLICVQMADIKSIDPPAALKAALKREFPESRKVKWTTEGSEFEAEFKVGSRRLEARFDSAASLLEVERDLRKKELPTAIQTFLNKEFPKAEIEEICEVKSQGVTTYEVEVETETDEDDIETLLIFDEQGALIKRTDSKD